MVVPFPFSLRTKLGQIFLLENQLQGLFWLKMWCVAES